VVSAITGRCEGPRTDERDDPLDNAGGARRRSYTVRFLVYPALLVGAFVLLSLVSFWLAVRPPRIAVPLRPDEFRLAVEDVTITAADGVKLAGWLAARPGAPALVLLHGYPAEKADLLPLAAALAPRFTVLLLDQRYFGASGGRATTIGFRERGDLRRAIDLLAARGFREVGVFGLSLGGAVALLAAAEDSRIRAVAAYAPFADLRSLAHDLYGWLWVLKYPFVWLLRGWSLVFFGHDITAVSPERAAATLAVPVLLVASRADEQIPYAHAERLSRALARNPRAELVTMDRGRHGELPPGFAARLAGFFLLYVR
jgi:pimeloyl-ACP methyl ester carboxylesterase